MKIFITGYICSGKTSIGKKLAEKLELHYIDMDKCFENKYITSISEFFNTYGEKRFRELEKKILIGLIKKEDTVISTGGGTPCYLNNMEIIKQSGISIYLKMSVDSLMKRILNSKTNRPLLNDVKEEKLENHISNQLSEREKYYKQSDIIVNNENTSINEIVALIRNFKRMK